MMTKQVHLTIIRYICGDFLGEKEGCVVWVYTYLYANLHNRRARHPALVVGSYQEGTGNAKQPLSSALLLGCCTSAPGDLRGATCTFPYLCGKQGQEAGELLAATGGYLRRGATWGDACPCREHPHFIYSPSLT